MAFDFVDDGLILENGAVVREIDGLRRVGEHLDFSAGVVVALFEGGEGLGCRAFEGERGGDFGPVDLEGGTPLEGRKTLVGCSR